MFTAPTYDFYASEYGGTLTEAQFDAQLQAARGLVAYVTRPAVLRNGEPEGDNLTAFQRATCAVIDSYAEYGTVDASSLKVGTFSITQGDAASSGHAMDAAVRELAETVPSYLYQGVS